MKLLFSKSCNCKTVFLDSNYYFKNVYYHNEYNQQTEKNIYPEDDDKGKLIISIDSIFLKNSFKILYLFPIIGYRNFPKYMIIINKLI